MQKDITEFLRREALNLGFCEIGFAKVPDEDSPTYYIFEEWLEEKKHASLLYLEKYKKYRKDIRSFLPFAKSVIGVLLAYPLIKPNNFISCYVTEPDYHKYIKNNLKKLIVLTEAYIGRKIEHFIAVDTALTSEREWAAKCGLGWIGKQGMLVNPDYGCCVFIGLAFVDIELPQSNLLTDNCNNCQICLQNCPTSAIGSNKTIDCNKCISFLTIEYRGSFNENTMLNGSLYGCDKCSSCCPFNQNRNKKIDNGKILNWMTNTNFYKKVSIILPQKIIEMSPSEFNLLFKNTPVKRIKLVTLQRNAKKILEEQKTCN